MGVADIVREPDAGLLAEYDNDGDLDVVVTNIDGLPELLENQGGNRRNFISFRKKPGRDR